MDVKARLIAFLISMVLRYLTGEKLKKFADKLLDLIEDTVTESKTEYDDAVVLPLCKAARDAFNIPDND